jgi:hypothetical protein
MILQRVSISIFEKILMNKNVSNLYTELFYFTRNYWDYSSIHMLVHRIIKSFLG